MYHRHRCPDHYYNGRMEVSGIVLPCCNDSRTTTCKISALIDLAQQHSKLKRQLSDAEQMIAINDTNKYALQRKLRCITFERNRLKMELDDMKTKIDVDKKDEDEYIKEWEQELNRLFGPTEKTEEKLEHSMSPNWITEYNRKKSGETGKRLHRTKSVIHSLDSFGEPLKKKRGVDL